MVNSNYLKLIGFITDFFIYEFFTEVKNVDKPERINPQVYPLY